MRILHVISGLRASAGGTVTALIGLAGAQRAAGCAVSIVSSFIAPEAEEAEALRQQGLRVRQIGPCRDPMSRHPQMRSTLRGLIAGGECDIVHIHGLWEQIQHEAAAASRAAGLPYVFSPHGMLDPWSLSQGRWKKRLYLALRLRRDLKQAAAIHFTTSRECELARPLGLGIPAIVEPIGIDLGEFDPPPPRLSFRARHGIAPDRPMLLFLARLHPKKGLDLLIPAAARALKGNEVLVLAGPDDGGYQQTVQQMTRQHAVADRVLFTGMLRGRERIEALVDADLFVLPSYQENFGIAVVEALAAGTPVLISDQVNIHQEISAAGVGGVVPTQVQPLAQEMARWLNDERLRRDAASRAIPFVREHYDWNAIARRWVEHYRALATPQRSAGAG